MRLRARDESGSSRGGDRAGAVRAAGHGHGIYLWHGQFLSRDRACRALGELFGCAPSPGALASAAKKTAGVIAPALAAITRYPASAEAAHFDETGFRTAGRLAWVHSASWGKFVLVTVHAKRGKDGMTAAGVLPFFTGIAVHDAWKPYDTFENVAGHALCGAHVLRELTAVTEAGTDLDRAWAQQAIDALLALGKAAEAVRAAGEAAMDPRTREDHEDWYRKAAATGITLNAGRGSKTFCAIRSYLATAARHGITWLDALTRAAEGNPWIPGTT